MTMYNVVSFDLHETDPRPRALLYTRLHMDGWFVPNPSNKLPDTTVISKNGDLNSFLATAKLVRATVTKHLAFSTNLSAIDLDNLGLLGNR